MSVVNVLADLQHWPGQSKIHFGILEDTIENVWTALHVNHDEDTFQPFASGCDKLATQSLDPSQFVGLLLRRPFQGLSHFDLPETLSCWAFTYIQNGREVALDIKTNGLSKQGFLFFREKILPVIDDIQNFRLHVGFLKQEEVPHHLGTSKAYRWNKNSKGLGCSIVIEQGHLLGMPWLLSMTDSMRFDLWTAKKSDSEDQKNAHETESEPSSRATSPTPSEMARVEDVLEGTSTNFSDLRSVLQCPEAVERTVGQEL